MLSPTLPIWLQGNDFFISGESFAGVYVPLISQVRGWSCQPEWPLQFSAACGHGASGLAGDSPCSQGLRVLLLRLSRCPTLVCPTASSMPTLARRRCWTAMMLGRSRSCACGDT